MRRNEKSKIAKNDPIKILDQKLISVPLRNIISKTMENTIFPNVKYIKSFNHGSLKVTTSEFYKPITRFIIIK